MEIDIMEFDLSIPSISDIVVTSGNAKTEAKLDLSVLAAKFNKRQEPVCRPCYAADRKTMRFKADNSTAAAWKNHRQIWVQKARKNGRFLVERADIGEYFLFPTASEAHAFVARMGAAYKVVMV